MTRGPLARKLRVLRAERGLTLREAASLTGVAKETISDIERGLRHPHDPTLAKIAKGYGVSVEDLLEEPALAGKVEAPDTGRPAEASEGQPEWASTPDLDTFNRKASEASSEELRDLVIQLAAGLPSAASLEDLRERPSDPTRVTRALIIARIHLIGDVLRDRGEEPPERIALAIRQWQQAMAPSPDEESRRNADHGAA
jgi:transcriptional regulator with XRE-family HTH domain